MIRVHAAQERNISSAADENKYRMEVKKMVELDQFKFDLNTYNQPLQELRDSL